MRFPSLYLNVSPLAFGLGREVSSGTSDGWALGFHVCRINGRSLLRLYAEGLASDRESDSGDNLVRLEALFFLYAEKASGASWEFGFHFPDIADWWSDRA